MKTKPPSCEGCPAFEWGLGFVEPEGPKTAAVAIVGQGPGEQEAEFSRPFIGRSGRLLDDWVRLGGGSRQHVWLSNLVWCWLPERKNEAGRGIGNRAPTRAESHYCYERHLGPALGQLREDVRIVATGGEAIRYLYGLGPDQPIEPYVGSATEITLPEVMPTNSKETVQ